MTQSIKKAGLIGGMSWESTVLYYQWINEGIKQQLGGLHSAPLYLFSVDFADVEQLQHAGDWQGAGTLLAEGAESLERAGADFLVICTNTMHKVADQVVADRRIPLLHIVDPTAEAIKAGGFNTVGLLGTGFTMTDDFYKGRMQQKHDINVLVPDQEDQATIHRIIYEELCLGIIQEHSRDDFLRIIGTLQSRGACGVILGCTEITLLVKQSHTDVPLIDTTTEHASAIVRHALGHSDL